jgi:hypothetical protein
MNPDRFTYILAILWTVAGMVYLGCVTFIPLSASGSHFADTILGFLLGTAFTSIISLFFHSNRLAPDVPSPTKPDPVVPPAVVK